MENEINMLAKGLKNFVDKSLDLINISTFFPNFKEKGGPQDGISMWIELIEVFTSLEIIYNKDIVPNNYKNVKYVRDLPEEDLKNCLIYLAYQLGMTEHTGGFNYYDLYKKYVKKY
jgi:hypothetical protein